MWIQQSQGVKGKPVQVRYELVTVSKECKAFVETATELLGRQPYMMRGKSGNLPDIGAGIHIPDHEILVVP